MRLPNQVAIITGAASGIGRATAIVLAREGAKVVVADIQETSRLETETPSTIEAIRHTGGEAIFIRADVSQRSQVEALVDETLRRFGRVDILVTTPASSFAMPSLKSRTRSGSR